VIGVGLRLARAAFRGLSRFWRDAYTDFKNTRTDFKNRHARRAWNLTRKNTRRAYDRVYGDARLLDVYLAPERLAFYREVADVTARLRPHSVIDVGCGPGNLLHELVERAAPERVVGIDHASAGIRRAGQLVPRGEFLVANLYDLKLEETFDVVLCTEVLEHVPDPAGAVERLLQLCGGSGAIVITVPDGATDTWEGHLNFWTAAELEEFLGRYGDLELSTVRGDLLAILRPRRELQRT
jgi:2-polyprenyl-3-methyl-5-hydroxy-6-metoxy-1,4-benzoquinol methylase